MILELVGTGKWGAIFLEAYDTRSGGASWQSNRRLSALCNRCTGILRVRWWHMPATDLIRFYRALRRAQDCDWPHGLSWWVDELVMVVAAGRTRAPDRVRARKTRRVACGHGCMTSAS